MGLENLFHEVVPRASRCLHIEALALSSYLSVILFWAVNIFIVRQYGKMFSVRIVFTHSVLFEYMLFFWPWHFIHYMLYNFVHWCLGGNNCILMKKWPRLAVIWLAVGCSVNIHPLFQFSSKADNDWRTWLIQKIMPGNSIGQVDFWSFISGSMLLAFIKE